MAAHRPAAAPFRRRRTSGPATQTLFDAGEDTRIAGAYVKAVSSATPSPAISARGWTITPDFGSGDQLRRGLPAMKSRPAGGCAPAWAKGSRRRACSSSTPITATRAGRRSSSTSFDLGVAYGERTVSRRPVYGAVTLFRRDSDDQIAFVCCFGETSGHLRGPSVRHLRQRHRAPARAGSRLKPGRGLPTD